jgi:hypothetical protein
VLARAAAARELAALPADSDGVVATESLLPFFTNREKLYLSNYQFLGVTQFALTPYAVPADTRWLAVADDDLLALDDHFNSTDWTKPHVAGGYARLRSVAQNPVATKEYLTLFEKSAAPPTETPTTAVNADFNDNLRLVGYSSTVSEAHQSAIWKVTLVWMATDQPKENWQQRLTLRDAKNQTVFDITYPFADGLTTSSELRPNGPNVTTVIEQTLPNLPPGQYTPTLTLERQTSHLELNTLGTAERVITVHRAGGKFELPKIEIGQ